MQHCSPVTTIYHVQPYLPLIKHSILPWAFHTSTAGIRSEDARCVAVRQLLAEYASSADEPQLQLERQPESCEADRVETSDTAAHCLSLPQVLQQCNSLTPHIREPTSSLLTFDVSGNVQIAVQDYKSVHTAIMTSATLVNTHTHTGFYQFARK